MAVDLSQHRSDIASAARAFGKLQFVQAFGHVSVRLGATLLITPTRPPLGAQQPRDVLEVDFEGRVVAGEASARPIEVFLHIGVYRARGDVAAICRTHAPAASVWRADKSVPEIQHGFGGIVGAIGLYDGCDLIHNHDLGDLAARGLGDADALILRGNGVLTVGASLGEAAARMWSLEERCALALRQGPNASRFSEEDLAARRRWYPAESERVWAWLKHLASIDSAHGGAQGELGGHAAN